jgi:hypothetical protein
MKWKRGSKKAMTELKPAIRNYRPPFSRWPFRLQ